MNTQQLLTASLLDIIFEGRNKEYGAYRLRKDYNRRIKKSMIITGVMMSLVIVLFSFDHHGKTDAGGILISDTILLQPLVPDAPPEPIQPPKISAPLPMVKTVQFTSPPKIVQDKDIHPDEMPPENSSPDHVKIDLITREGINTGVEISPPQGTSNGVVANMDIHRQTEDSVFRKVEIESTYPGGAKAWARFLNKTFIYPQKASENEIEGTVVVRFIIDQLGNAGNIVAISGPDELKAEAIRVIKKSGKWNPAIQNGRMVKSYKQQPIIFNLVAN